MKIERDQEEGCFWRETIGGKVFAGNTGARTWLMYRVEPKHYVLLAFN